MNETEANHLRSQLEAAVHDADSLASRLAGLRPAVTGTADNGARTSPIQVVSGAELNDIVASYHTALVALVALVKREGGYRPTEDQMLIKEIVRLIEKHPR